MKPFLILQIRPLDEASDNEFEAFLKYGGLQAYQARRIRIEQAGIPELKLDDYSGIILGGGPSNVSDDPATKSVSQKRFEADLDKLLDQVFERDFPFFGVCYGMGALAQHQGAVISTEKYGEAVGVVAVSLTEHGRTDKLLKNIPDNFMAYCGHKEACQDYPTHAKLLATSESCPVQMVRFQSNIYATQFHTELDHDGINLRIEVYKNHGYFDPEHAEILKKATKETEVIYPEMILEAFTDYYKRK